MGADSFHFDTETWPLTPEEQAPDLVCLQYCVAPAPRLVGASTGRATRSDGRLIDSGEAWRGMTSLDILGPCPPDEATEEDEADPVKSCAPAGGWPDATTPVLLDCEEAIDAFRWAVEDTDLLVIGLNVPFDLLVMLRKAKSRGLDLWRAVFEMMAAARLRDTEVSQKLLNIAVGREMYKTGMEALAKFHLGIELGSDKRGPSSWRLRYRHLHYWPASVEAFVAAEHLGIVTAEHTAAARKGLISPGTLRPIETWPYHARRYALDDVIHDREIWRRQRDEAVRIFGKPDIPDEIARAVFRFCLHLQSARGITPDYHRAVEARSSLEATRDHLMTILIESGLIKRKQVWTSAGVQPGSKVRVRGELSTEEYRFVDRCTAKGVPNLKGRCARIEGEETDEERIVPLADLETLEVMGPGVELTRDMAEIRRRVTATLLANGYKEHEIPMTDGGERGSPMVKTDKDVMDIVASKSDDRGLQVLGAKGKVDKLLTTYIEPLCQQRAVHFRYDVVKDTGRTSTSAQRFMSENTEGVLIQIKEGTNVQNFPQNEALARTAREILKHSGHSPENPDRWVVDWVDAHSPRKMIVARPGFVFSIHDFSSIELGTFSRTLNIFMGKQCAMAKAINEGKDLHCFTGVEIHPLLWNGERYSYSDLVALRKIADKCKAEKKVPPPEAYRVGRTRQTCKPVNFGFLGGMGAAKFCFYALQSYGVALELPIAKAARKGWLKTYPDIQPHYFDRISEHHKHGRPVIQIGTKRMRKADTYSAMCNSYFQGLAADGAAQACWRLTYASYIDEESPLFGSFPLIFEHDCFVVEVPERNAEAAHEEVGRLMVEGMEVYLTDRKRPELSVAVKTEGVLDHRWSK